MNRTNFTTFSKILQNQMQNNNAVLKQMCDFYNTIYRFEFLLFENRAETAAVASIRIRVGSVLEIADEHQVVSSNPAVAL